MGRGTRKVLNTPSSSTSEFRQLVSVNAQRIATLGQWPAYIDPQQSLTARVPVAGETAPGFDAGIACALDMIPRANQTLAAALHAAYTPKIVAQVREESKQLKPDLDSCWWLAACSVCTEGAVTAAAFQKQIAKFETLRNDPQARLQAASSELQLMRSRYQIQDGVAFSTIDGGMQGAYLDGHNLAVMFDQTEGLYFVGTFYPSLGLEDFPFSNKVDDQGRPRSGAVHGSRQFVKACDVEEYQRLLQWLQISFTEENS